GRCVARHLGRTAHGMRDGERHLRRQQPRAPRRRGIRREHARSFPLARGRVLREGRRPATHRSRQELRRRARGAGRRAPSGHGGGDLALPRGQRRLGALPPGGVAFGSFPLIVDFLADGSIVFATGSPPDDSNQLYRRGPSDEGWRRLEGDDALPSYHNVVAMAAGGDGTLLFGTHRLDVGEGGRGLLYLVQSGSERYEPVSLDGLPAWNPSDAPTSVNLVDVGWLDDGSAVVAIDAHGLFRLAP